MKHTTFKSIPKFTKEGSWEPSFDLEELNNKIKEWVEDKCLDLNPDFQRGHVWTEEQQIKYIEFILQGGKTGTVIYLNAPRFNEGIHENMVVVDGKQRLEALRRFIENEIPVFGSFFKEYTDKRMMPYLKINMNTLKTKKDVIHWYLEMNSGGTPHTQEELERVKQLIA